MTTQPPPGPARQELLAALGFIQNQFARWQQQGQIHARTLEQLQRYYEEQLARLEAGEPVDPLRLRPGSECWSCRSTVLPGQGHCGSCGAPINEDATTLRHWIFLCHEIKKHEQTDRLTLAVAHACLAEGNARIAALRKKLDQERAPLAEPVPAETSIPPARPVVRSQPTPPPVPTPRRPFLEILLDPRSIQWLLASGGVLLVLGLVIYLATIGFFENPTYVAILLGIGNAALLVAGCATVLRTRYQKSPGGVDYGSL